MKSIKGLLIIFVCSIIGTLLGGICLCIPQVLPFGITLITVAGICAMCTGAALLAFLY